MYITKEQFEEIREKYGSLFVLNSDVGLALDFVHDLLAAEADAMQAAEPEATVSIDRLNKAAYEVFEVQQEIENEDFMEQEGDLPKCVSIPVSKLQLDEDFFSYDTDGSFSYDEELGDIVGDYLSDTYGYCHRGFHFEFGCINGRVEEIVATDIQWDVDKDEELTVVRTMDELEAYLEDKGWTVNKDEEGWEIGQASPAGEDFWFFIRHDNDVEKAVTEIQEYAYDFDVNEHVEMWIEARRNHVAGVPDAATLVEDAQAIQEMLDELADGVNWCEQKTIGEMLAEAQGRVAVGEISGKHQEDKELD